MTRLNRPEQQYQRAVIQHIAWRARPGVFAFHVPNGGWRSRVEGAILKAIGTVAGVPDIICIFQGRVYALELKAGRGRLTDVQRVVHERLRWCKPCRSARNRSGAARSGGVGTDKGAIVMIFSAVQAHRRHARTAIGIIGGTTWQIGDSSHE